MSDLYCSTWTLSRETAADLFALIDEGKIDRVSFLTGLYFKRREAAVYNFLLTGLRQRGGRYRAFPNHCKLLLLAAGQTRLVIEGSANLTGNPRAEQYAITHDATLYDFCRDWFEAALERLPAPKPADADVAAERLGFSQRRAGLGVLAARRDKASRRRALGWKMATFEDEDITRAMARAIAATIRQAQPTMPPGTVLTCPPQGATWPGYYLVGALAQTVADDLGLPFKPGLITRPDVKHYHGPHDALAQPPFSATDPGPAVVVVDDLITSGATMLRALKACRDSGAAAWGYAFSGC